MSVYIGSNFAKRKNTWMQIVIGTEGEEVELKILPPTVGIFRGVQEAASIVKSLVEGDKSASLEDAFEYVASAMSNNVDSVIVTPKTLSDMAFNIMDIGEFIAEYTEFLVRLADGKN